jgi:hypothetical protein
MLISYNEDKEISVLVGLCIVSAIVSSGAPGALLKMVAYNSKGIG